jgi:anti-anti-sigma factor
MQAKVEDRKGVFIVSLSGQLNFEKADALKNKCSELFTAKKVVFNMRNLSFVGSSGITPFLDLLRHLLRENGSALKVCAVGTEFMRLFEAGRLNGLEVYENELQACMAFDFMESPVPIKATVPEEVPVNFAMDAEMLDADMLDAEIKD